MNKKFPFLYSNIEKRLILLILFILFYFICIKVIKESNTKSLEDIMNPKNDNLTEIQYFIDLNYNETLINLKFLKKVDEPLISIVITNFNGDFFLRKSVRSIQNQEFPSLEIIIVDDNSIDNSISKINELMMEDPRIKLLKNLENKGTFYSRAKGVLNAKGKYILFLDVDDLYTSKDAFSTLYKVAEKYDLDILSFACITSDRFILNKKLRIIYYYETPILFQPNISERVYYIDKNGEVVNYGNVLWCYLFRKKVVLDSLKEIPKKFFDVKISHHDDILLLFVITRKAKSMKYLKRIFHIYLSHHPNETSTIYKNNRVIYKIKTVCLSNIYFLEFLLLKTKDTFEDKMIVSSETERWYLNNSCIDDELAKKEGIQYCKQLLQNKYIKYDIKRKIELYLSKII